MISIKLGKTPIDKEIYAICREIAMKYFDYNISLSIGFEKGNLKDLVFLNMLDLKENDILDIETDEPHILEDIFIIFNKIIPVEIIQ